MKNINKYSLVFSTVLGVLVGCGGESSSPSRNDGPSSTARWNQIKSQDVNYKIPLTASSKIDLADYTQAINSGAKLTLTSFEQIGDRASCTQYETEQTQVAFHTGFTQAQECYYQYTMHDTESGSTSSAILRVSASSLQVDEPVRQFSAVTQINGTVKININNGNTVPEGYVIDENSIQILGHGTAQINEMNKNEIYYHAGGDEFSQGLHRIVFSYIRSEDQSVIQGLVDVAVGLTIKNHAPRVINFRYGDPASYTQGQQLKHAYIEEGQEVTINIAQYYNQGYLDANNKPVELLDDNGSPIYDEQMNRVHYFLKPDGVTSTPIYQPGNYLIDRDKDILQLTNVFAYNAYVKISSENFTSTEFTFRSYKRGTHYVTYVLSDHNGGYGTGIIEIKVGEDIPTFIAGWDPILTTETRRFKSPMTRYDADYQGFEYTIVTAENGTDGPAGTGTPLFDYRKAASICSHNGMRLPKLDELTSLKNTYPNGLYNSLDIYNPLESKRKNKINWPTSASFWVLADSDINTTSVVKLNSSFNVQSPISITSNEQHAVVCIVPGTLTDITVSPSKFSLLLGDTEKLTAMGTYIDKTIPYMDDITSSVTWEVSDTAIATVTKDGLLKATRAGKTSVSALNGSITSNPINITVCRDLEGCSSDGPIRGGLLLLGAPSVDLLNAINEGPISIPHDIVTDEYPYSKRKDKFYVFSVAKGPLLCNLYNTLNYMGRTDWHVPTSDMLQRAVDNGRFAIERYPNREYYLTSSFSPAGDITIYDAYYKYPAPTYGIDINRASYYVPCVSFMSE